MNNSIIDFSDDEHSDNEKDQDEEIDELTSENNNEFDSIETVYNEVSSVNTILDSLIFKNIIETNISEITFRTIDKVPNEDNSIIYDLSEHKLFEDLTLKIGNTVFPRLSCACHKLNIVIHSAIENQGFLKVIIQKLSSFAGSIRNSISLNQIFTDLKCRPKIENKTRWFSQYYVLLWAKKAYEKDTFDQAQLKCPVSLKIIESYIQILLPAYQMNLGLQGANACISDVLPSILRLNYIWNHMRTDYEQKELLYFLIFFLKKFKYEMESHLYHVIILIYLKLLLRI